MKKYLVLIALVLGSGCGDSTQDVAMSGDVLKQSPDTIITKDGLTAEFYGPDHASSPGREAFLTTSDDLTVELNRMFEEGYLPDASGSWFVDATLPDGRYVEMTWTPLVDALGSEAMIVRVQVGDQEVARSFRECCTEDVKPESPDKRKEDPSLSFGYYGCFGMARSLYYMCVSDCVKDGGSDRGCRKSCFLSAAFAFLYCLFINS